MSDAEITFVNVIDVEPEKYAEVLALLKEGTESVISKRQGFVSVTLLASKDHRRLINIAKWRSAEDIRATQADPAAAEFTKRMAQIGTPSPGLFEVVGEYSA